MLLHTVEITIGKYRNDTAWQRKKLTWSDLVDNLGPDGKWFHRTHEKYKEYLKFPKDRQDEIKDVGGFVGGIVIDGRRKRANVLGRTLVTLDIDHMTAEQGRQFWPLYQHTYNAAAILYSTHKHSPDTPRYRLIIPLDRIVTVEEYAAICRRIAGAMDIDQFDHTGFQEERLMYFPSCSADGVYVYKVQDGPLLCARDILDSYGIGPRDNPLAKHDLTGWQDSSQWPVCEREHKVLHKSAGLQGNPLEKPGIVGTFCRTFNIHEAIETFLPNVYSRAEGAEDRYTYIHGSTSAGATIYPNETGEPTFLYSYHGTDPANNGHLVNAFDLVRIHKFGALDENYNTENQEDVTKLPSYKAMLEYATRNPLVRIQGGKDRLDQAQEAFRGVILPDHDADEIQADQEADAAEMDDINAVIEPLISGNHQRRKEDRAPEGLVASEHQDVKWLEKLDIDKKGTPRSTIANVVLILENDPNFKERLWYDAFRHRLLIRNRVPWRRVKEYNAQWQDKDDAALRHYLEKVYQISGVQKVNDGLGTLATRQSFHPVKDMLKKLKWDGAHRIDRLLIDYLGADDTEYVRTVTRKTLVAAVSRIMRPGIKFDHVLTLVGEEGKMKSMLFDHLAYPWFSDSLTTVTGKEAFEQIQGYWIIEMGELSALSKAEHGQVKHYISKRIDSYRAPWGHNTIDHPRQCIFVATTNEEKFLKGINGDRKFWPVSIDVHKPSFSVASLAPDKDIDRVIVGQIWAEAMEAFRNGETLYLDEKMFYTARAVQEEHTFEDARAGAVAAYLDMDLPIDWYELDLPGRRSWVKGENEIETKKVLKREKVCIREIWQECFGKPIGDLNRRDSEAIAHIMDHTKGWKKSKGTIRIPNLPGTHRGWVRRYFDV